MNRELLESLSSPNNAVRTAAEQGYEALKARPQESNILPALLNSIVDASIPSHLRVLAAVLLRRMLIEAEESVYYNVSPEIQSGLKQGLISALSAERDPYLKARICDIIGELAGYVLESSEWPNVIPYTYGLVQSSDALDRETGLTLLGMIAENVVEVMGRQNNFSAAAGILDRSLRDTANAGKVMVAALRTLSALTPLLPDQSVLDSFRVLIPAIIEAFKSLTSATLDHKVPVETTMSFVEVLIDMDDDNNKFFDSHMGLVYESVVEIFESAAVPMQLRNLCLEFIVTLCINSPKKTRKTTFQGGKPVTVLGKCWFASRVLPVCVNFLADVSDDPSWDAADFPEESVESASISDVSEVALDRMCKSLGLGSTWPVISQQITQLLSHGHVSWKYNHAALRLLGNYLEVTTAIPDKKELAQHRRDVEMTLAKFVRDSHARVRGACFYALGEYFSTHCSSISAEKVDEFLPALLESLSMHANPQPRVRRYVLLALVCLIDRAPASAIQGKAGVILSTIAIMMRDDVPFLHEFCILVIISLCESVRGKYISDQYDLLMPCVKSMLSKALSHGNEVLWAQGIECCAIIGEASGKSKFYSDAVEMMSFLSTLETGSFGNEAEVKKHLLKAWIRIARCLGSEFSPFLPIIVSHLFEAILQDVRAGDVESPEDAEDRSDIQMVESDKGWVAVRTAAVEEQASACQLVVLLAERLQDLYFPYVEKSVSAMSELLDSVHEDVRSFCIVAMPEFIRSTAKATCNGERAPLLSLVEFILGKLVQSITTESIPELVMTGLQALKLSLIYACTNWSVPQPQTSGPIEGGITWADEAPRLTPTTSIPFLNVAQMRAISDALTIVIRDNLQRRAMLRAEAQLSGGADENDASDENLFLAEYMEMQYTVAEVVGTLFRTHGALYFDTYMAIWHPVIETMTSDHCLKEDKQFSFALLSDLIEFGFIGATSENNGKVQEYLNTLIPLVCETCGNSVEPGLRQTCAYTIGVLGEKYPNELSPYVMKALQSLAASVTMGEDPPHEMKGPATDNAVSAIGTLLERLEASGVALNYAFMWNQWASYGPLEHDKDECDKVARQICRMLLARHPHVTGSQELFVHCVSNLIKCVSSDFCSAGVARDAAKCLQAVQLQFPAAEVSLLEGRMASEPGFRAKVESYLLTDVISSPLGAAPIHDLLMGSRN